MEFQEGIHKSSRRETAPEPEQEPENERSPKKRPRWLLVLGVVLLVCVVVGGGILAFQLLRNPHAPGQVTLADPGWCSVPVTGLNTDVGMPELNEIDAVSANDIWMAGYLVSQNSNTPNQAVIEHWDGKNLSVTPSPNSGGNGSRLRAIAEIAPNDVWAVGSVLQTPQNGNDLGDLLFGIHTLIEHWDGHHWSIVSSPDGAAGANSFNELLSVATISADDIWTAGYSRQSGRSGALIEHWDGHQWNVMSLPDSFHSSSLREVAAPAKDDIWVLGYADASPGQGVVPLLAHWDGHQWNLISGLNKDLIDFSLQAFSSHNIWVTGHIRSEHAAPSGLTVVAHWDGVSLQQQTLPRLLLQVTHDSSGQILYQDQASVFTRSFNDIWVAGGEVNNGLGIFATSTPVFLEHWDGKSWQVASLPHTPVGQLTVLAVVGGKVWAAGTMYIGDQQAPAQLVEMSC